MNELQKLMPLRSKTISFRRIVRLIAAAMCCIAAIASAAVDPSSFRTLAKFSVDKQQWALTSAIAVIEPRAPGYSWVRIYFFPSPLSPGEATDAANGHVDALEKKWQGVIQLTTDAEYKVTQVDMSVPGHACTIAPFEPDVKRFLQEYKFDGSTLRLSSKGSYLCDMKFMGIANQDFGWDIDLRIPVSKKIKSAK
jgi:hypothetical protein